VATGAISTEPDTQAAIGQFFTNSPDFDIRTTRITSYVTANGPTAFGGIAPALQPAVIAELQRLQRTFQISVSADSMTTLHQLELDAAHKVADIPRRASPTASRRCSAGATSRRRSTSERPTSMPATSD
jgi:hypothetical protein